jgi:salicylate hydroxylase
MLTEKATCKFKVLVVGAGTAGLSTAIALKRKGHDVTVLERHPAVQALGGPVTLWPNGTRVLIEYGMQNIFEQRFDAIAAYKERYYRRYADGSIIAPMVAGNPLRLFGSP